MDPHLIVWDIDVLLGNQALQPVLPPLLAPIKYRFLIIQNSLLCVRHLADNWPTCSSAASPSPSPSFSLLNNRPHHKDWWLHYRMHTHSSLASQTLLPRGSGLRDYTHSMAHVSGCCLMFWSHCLPVWNQDRHCSHILLHGLQQWHIP